jgi:hypothetical protein
VFFDSGELGLGRRMERTHEQERTGFVQDWRRNCRTDCMRIRTQRLYENRAAVQIGAATGVMHGYWMTMAELFDCRAILVRPELASHRRAVEVRYHDAQGHNAGQAVNCFQNGHGRRNSFCLQCAFQKNVPAAA